MKKFIYIFPTVALLILSGAGCDNGVAVDRLNAPSNETPVAAPANSEVVPVAPVVTSTTSNPTPPTTMNQPLAFPGELPAAEVNKKVRIKTTLGDIVIQMDRDQGPKAASNFVYLVKQKFYDGTIFHRVIPGFMIQGGDPTGTGRGGPGYQFANDPVKTTYSDGIVAMANAGRDTNGSQFFIMVADYPLGPDYSIFGHVVSGLDVAHKIADVQRDQNDRPMEEVKMISVTLE